jgi:hypothetical protein
MTFIIDYRCPYFEICKTKTISMKQNMGNADRIIRTIVAVAIGALYYQNIISGTLAYVLLAVAGIFLLTSIVSICPLYNLIGINTCGAKHKQ